MPTTVRYCIKGYVVQASAPVPRQCRRSNGPIFSCPCPSF
jgi:hypothetical protein